MDVSDLPGLTIRLRHLSSIKCRYFQLVLDDMELADGILFAISSIEPEDIGYLFVSPVSRNTKNPEWDSLELSNLGQWALSAKAAMFTFFLQHGHVHSVLFELKVHFSGLIPIDIERHFSHASPSSLNEVYFQFHGSTYAPPCYMLPDTCDQCVLSSSMFSIAPKLSYDFEHLQWLIVNTHLFRSHADDIERMEKSVQFLEEFLAPFLEFDARREAALSNIYFLKRRLHSALHDRDVMRSRIQEISQHLAATDQNMRVVIEAESQVEEQLRNASQALAVTRQRFAKLSNALSARTGMLISEMLNVFTAELARHSPQDSAVAGFTLKSRASTTDFISSGKSISSSTDVSSTQNRSPDDTPQPLRDLQPVCQAAIESDSASAAVSLGVVAMLLRLLAAILNVPLRHPLDLREGVSRAKIIDSLSFDPTENPHSFPLHLSRSSVLPAYKHGILLLNQNLSALRAICGMPKSAEDSVIWNFITLLQYCVSNRSQLRLA